MWCQLLSTAVVTADLLLRIETQPTRDEIDLAKWFVLRMVDLTSVKKIWRWPIANSTFAMLNDRQPPTTKQRRLM
jgi:hypothetical protein